MAFFLQYREIQRHVKEELQRTLDSPDELSTTALSTEQDLILKSKWKTKSEKPKFANKPINESLLKQIPGISIIKNEKDELLYYQVDWTGPNDPFNPKTWSTTNRIYSTLLVCLVAFTATFASSIDSAILTRASSEFGVSEVAESLATALFLIGFGLGALLLSPLSELVGRFPVYLGSLFVFGCWILGAALTPTFAGQLVFRFLAGFSASTPLTVAGGSIGDLWSPVEKTFAFPMFAIPAFGGPILGPVVGAYIGYEKDVSWRWAEWVVLILDGVAILLILLCQPESFGPRILHYKAKAFRRITGNEKFKTAIEASHPSMGAILSKCFVRPFQLCTEPIVLAFTFYLAIVYIILFTFLDGYPFIFAQTYNINDGLSNICFLGIMAGILSAAILVPIIYRSTVRQLKRDKDDGSGRAIHRESRLYFAMIGAPALPIGLFWMGWTDYPSISIWSPLSASLLIGFSNICIFMSAYMYIIDSYEAYAASALTFVALVRYIAAGGMTVVGIPMYRNLGTHWTLTVLGGISVIALPIPYVLYWFGPRVRGRSKWAV